MWLSAFAFIVSIVFLIRSLEIIPGGQPLLNALVCLFSLLAALFFLPGELISSAILEGFGWFVAIFAGSLVLIEFVQLIFKRLLRWGSLRLQTTAGLSPEHDEICKALDHMAKQKTGALIVLERKGSLKHLYENGFQFDSDVRAEVIISLFDKNSPLHDGAMIISQNRIKALKIILPLTTRSDVPLGIGTRHRSAIGLTETTDAIALISSEERGMLSISYQGALVVANSKNQFAELLKRALKGFPIIEPVQESD